jgi:hypothetical protein
MHGGHEKTRRCMKGHAPKRTELGATTLQATSIRRLSDAVGTKQLPRVTGLPSAKKGGHSAAAQMDK